VANGTGTKDDPWQLRTPPGTSEYTMYRDDSADPPLIVCMVGSTKLTYLARAIDDLHAMLKQHAEEAWARAEDNPVGGWYGQRKGYRGRFGMYLPPLMEALGLVELTHEPRGNRMRAL